MITVSDALLRCPLFEGIDPAELSGMLDCLGARQIFCKRGEAILPEGAPARDVGVLLSGQVQLIRTDYYGNRSIMLSIGPGQLFAESFACAKADRLPVSVVAVEDCEVLLLDCRRVLTSCHNACAFHSRIIFNLLQIVAEKNLSLHRKAVITARRTTREKLLTYLLLQAKEAGRADFTIPFDRQGLADYLEVDRSGLSAEMSKLKKEGVLDYYKSDFRLLRVQDGMAEHA
ncbi:MAG: Crp/Fnr family transcriptional regulator [Clostridia bacterium]|nr:Crp/Fnr family transcriptional regulator [Clostridia bacterium]